jgi:transcriptional regulator with XRE-family HTH domain
MALADRIRDARKAANLTLDQLAAEAGVSKTYLWELENDKEGAKKPSAEVLLKIANALSTTLADLLELPSIRVDRTRLDLSPSLREFRERMKALGAPLTDSEVRDLAAMRFRGGQPRTADDWHDLYRVLKRSAGD